MKTFTLNPSGQSPGWLLLLICCFLIPTINQAQSTYLKKGYSKSDLVFTEYYLTLKQEFNQKQKPTNSNKDVVPENDLCQDAISIYCDVPINGTTIDATHDNMGFCGTDNTAPGVWYTFVATNTLTNLSTCDQADYDTKISVYSGSCDDLVCVDGQDDGPGCSGFTTDLEVSTIPGETYFVLVHGWLENTGNFTLTMTCYDPPPPPANDLCEDAIALQCGDVVSENTELATDIGAITDCSEDGFLDNPGYGVWYTIQGTGGEITLSTCDATNFDNRIDVFSGLCGDLTCYAGSDDEPQCPNLSAEVTFASAAGEIYIIYVHGFSSARGDFTMTVICTGAPPPVNDLCENAEPISCVSSVDGTTINATIDNVGDCGTSNTAPGVWYSFLPEGNVINLSTCNQADFNTKISAFTGSCENLVCVDGQDDEAGCGNTTNLYLGNPGEPYFVLVHGFGDETGDFTLSIDCYCTLAVDAGPCATVYYGYEPAECTDLTATATLGSPPYSYLWSTGETTATITVCPTISTTYTVTVTDADDCVATDDVTIDVIDVRCGKKLDKVEICHIPPGNPNNQKTHCLSPNAVQAHLEHGDHLGACDIDPCDGLYTIGLTPDSGLTGIGSSIDNDGWKIYPNPALNIVYLDLATLTGQEVKLSLYDVTGKVYWNYPLQILESNLLEVDLKNIPAGIYYLVMQDNNKLMAKKLVITK